MRLIFCNSSQENVRYDEADPGVGVAGLHQPGQGGLQVHPGQLGLLRQLCYAGPDQRDL